MYIRCSTVLALIIVWLENSKICGIAIAKKIKATPDPRVIIVLLLNAPINVNTETIQIIVMKHAKKYFKLYSIAPAIETLVSSINVINVSTFGKNK